MEDFSRAANLRITGIGEQQGETMEQAMLKVQKIISDNLQLPNVRVQHAYRILQQGDGTQSRAILAKLPSADDKMKCLRVSSKPKGKDIYINDDLSKQRAQLVKHAPVLKKKTFSWPSTLDNLCSPNICVTR